MTDWTDKAIDFMVLYDEEKSLWQIGKRSGGRWVAVRHDPLVVEPHPGSWPHAIATEFLKMHDFASEAEARNYVRCHAAEVALRETFKYRIEVPLT